MTSDKKTDKKDDKKDARKPAKPSRRRSRTRASPDGKPRIPAAKPDDKPADADADDAADNADTPSIAAPENSARARPTASTNSATSAGSSSTAKKIEELIAVLKSKGVPVLWVGLPAIRGPKGISDMLFLDALYRDGAGKAGITYVDVWDGFVDEAGRFLQQGPDFEGQIRQLRTYDGVFSPSPARASSRTMSIARSSACSPHAPARRAAERAGDARCQRRSRPACAASAGRTDPAAGGGIGRHRSVARRPRLASGRGRCARRAHAGQGRSRWRRPPAAPTISPGRAAKSAANRPRATRRLQRRARWRSGSCARTTAAAAATAAARLQQQKKPLRPAQTAADAARFLRRFGNIAAPPASGRAAPAGPRPPANRAAPAGRVGRSAAVPAAGISRDNANPRGEEAR